VRPNVILVVDDNPGDVWLIREALSGTSPDREVRVVTDGEQAVAFLRGEAPFEGAPRPDLVLLDLNLPKVNGHEVLAEMKADPALASIPVVVLSTSRAQDDVVRAYKGHANSFVSKPLDLDGFFSAIQQIDAYWFSTARLPMP
jgi:CheY-like chemotaxis protein